MTIEGIEVYYKRTYGIESQVDTPLLDSGLPYIVRQGRGPLTLSIEILILAQGEMTANEAKESLIDSLKTAQEDGSTITISEGDFLDGEYYVQSWNVSEERASFVQMSLNLIKEE